MKTPIERITDFINDSENKNRNVDDVLKELRARILQDTYTGYRVEPQTCEHNYQIAKSDYYKQTGKIGVLGVMTYNIDITYSMLFCTKCGETKEIITSG